MGLAETIIRDSLNEFDDRIMERKISKQVIESLGFTDNMSSVEEKTPTVSPKQDATGETATSVQLAEAMKHPKIPRLQIEMEKGGGEEHYFRIQQNNGGS